MRDNSKPLPPPERIAILTTRIANLKNGSGDYAPEARGRAIAAAEHGLRDALDDQRKASA